MPSIEDSTNKVSDKLENIIGTTEPFLHCKDFEYSKDYITNLQQRIDKAIEYIENYLCSDEYIQSDINSIANALVKLVDILKGVDKE